MLLSDRMIRYYVQEYRMIEPFAEAYQEEGVISYGLTSAGYDLRLANKALVLKNTHCLPLDPRKMKDPEYQFRIFDIIEADNYGGEIWIPANGYILVSSFEYLRIPRFLKARCVGKSTYARCGLIVNCTPLEPEWEGNLTIEISNSSPCPVPIITGQGIAQLEFEVLSDQVQTSYKDKRGKYQCQQGVTPARVL